MKKRGGKFMSFKLMSKKIGRFKNKSVNVLT